ncbi:MAG: outer membrane lipid asymmetry maintenance protein MlaD [Desulfobacula sp.]|jgi:phospholipid/cholesterol/gamma-HCH transport system substrate-binding protein|uniref:outer membrane lipid asymmetry maintenance protein MlaD n=1 Tax=Desulfobacula sp. TaxID=2593537 RepID=UPI001DA3B7F8|nr:outer membrane lipid asymmetry maintenance protein MlaD [Desulfobacula sp.]MBT3486905.1 outer membrane lipid asymmetry maintenance protein MlaD [Desulfobacula sp.]MBT3805619.1 outer membrane lipid asymmetry maintenance protein MlaD [Desulfobacula sp.]MBT4026491.1 outer membrane lipid asymmetry maintenance protein MlaD [Desulfobacula sp.]MBT4199618.1 outer membrane lipid asymmetry maintenance protein MlaD [Desulfobacula sp.]
MYGRKTEISVGIFMMVGIACLVYLSINLGNVDLFGSDSFMIDAKFGSIEGLEVAASVEIAGVPVGKVKRITLEENEAFVQMEIKKGTKITEDTIASIRTKGIIGDKFVKLSPGGSDNLLGDKDVLMDTESAISLEELVSKYIFKK